MRTPTGTIIPFPRERCRPTTSGVRVAYVADRWCVERLDQGIIIDRQIMPARSDAQRVAVRTSRRDKVTLLPPALTDRPRPWSGRRPSTPDDAA
ncbi:hypothetical protein FOHLNKBM_5862 [Methylobacterium longum]|nr:hypothetical protein FOHLNKBM_5862 [Methylobacterium longum]